MVCNNPSNELKAEAKTELLNNENLKKGFRILSKNKELTIGDLKKAYNDSLKDIDDLISGKMEKNDEIYKRLVFSLNTNKRKDSHSLKLACANIIADSTIEDKDNLDKVCISKITQTDSLIKSSGCKENYTYAVQSEDMIEDLNNLFSDFFSKNIDSLLNGKSINISLNETKKLYYKNPSKSN